MIKGCLEIFELKTLPENTFHLSIIYSMIGNLFFKLKFFEESLEFKKIAFEKMKNIQNQTLSFPSFF